MNFCTFLRRGPPPLIVCKVLHISGGGGGLKSLGAEVSGLPGGQPLPGLLLPSTCLPLPAVVSNKRPHVVTQLLPPIFFCPRIPKTCYSNISLETCHSSISLETCHSSISLETCHSNISLETCHSSVSLETCATPASPWRWSTSASPWICATPVSPWRRDTPASHCVMFVE